jgi:hypothetical protein
LGKIFKNKIMAMDISNPSTIIFYPEKNIDKPGIVFNKITRKNTQFYQDLEDNGGFVYEDKIYSFGKGLAGKKVLIKIDEMENRILCFPGHNLEEKPLVKPINESEEVQFYEDIDGRNRFKCMGKRYRLGIDFPSKKVAVIVNKGENRIYIYPDQDFNKPPVIFDSLTGKRIQYYRNLRGKNNRFYYQDKVYCLGTDFASKKMVVTLNESENRIYIYPDQDLNKPPVIFDSLTGKRIQFYQKLHNEGEFGMNKVKFDLGEGHKNKLAVVRINDKKNEISVFPDGNLNENPIVFNKTTGKLKKMK